MLRRNNNCLAGRSKIPITCLPLEILSHIMSYLDFSSRREASLVCRSWYEASLDPVFLKNTKYTFDSSVLEDENQYLDGKHLLAGCLCKSPNLHIVGLDENFNAKYFLSLHKSGMEIVGSHVEHLSLKNSNLLEGTLLEILQHCPNVKSLDLSGCNSLFMAGSPFGHNSKRLDQARRCLHNITALNLSSSRYMNDGILCQLFSMCPFISSITLSSNNLLCNSHCASKSNSLTFLTVLQLISLHSSNVTHVDFSRTSISSDCLSMLSIIRGLKLKSVVLQNCRELTDAGVVELAHNQLEIENLVLSGSSEIGNASLCAICEHSKKLQVLKLRKCSKITSSSVKHLHKLKNLCELDLSECHLINMAALQAGLDGMERLRILQLKCCNLSGFKESFFLPLTLDEKSNDTHTTSSSTVALTSLAIRSPSVLNYALQQLDIGSSQYVDDATLQAVCFYLTNLQVLRLSWCSAISDRGILGLPPEKSFLLENDSNEATTKEEKLNAFLSSGKYSSSHGQAGLIKRPGIEFVPGKMDFCGKELLGFMESRGIVRLKKLRELTLSNCKKLSAVGLLHVFRYKNGPFPYLETLDLGMLHQAVNDDVIDVISFAGLRNLSLAFCGLVTDQALQRLLKKLRSLDLLNISNCDGITEKTICCLATCCPWLKELDVSMCRQIPAQTASQIKEMVPSLLRLHTRYSGGASLEKTL